MTSAGPMLIYEPAASNAPSPVPAETTLVRHPSYPPHSNIIFSFFRNDSVAEGETHGIHYGTLLTACRIMAGNLPGFLSLDHEGSEEISASWDDVVMAPSCYYQPHGRVGSNEDPYPICWSLAEWQFPHGELPPEWLAADIRQPDDSSRSAAPSAMTSTVNRRDITCRITSTPDATENSHIVPVEHREWFVAQSMEQYNTNKSLPERKLVDDVSNGILLRADLHQLWNNHHFFFVPKFGSFAVHTHSLKAISTFHQYHNHRLHPLSGVSVEFLYARFAIALFPLTSGFHARLRIQAPSSVRTKRQRDDNTSDESNDDTSEKRKNREHQDKEKSCKHGRPKGSRDSGSQATRKKTATSSRPTRTKTTTANENPWYEPYDFVTAGGRDTRSDTEIEEKAEFLINTEHPAEVYATLWPPVGQPVDNRLIDAVERKIGLSD